MVVILAEKPDQARKLSAPFPHKKEKTCIQIQPCTQFPQGAIVVWAIGHLYELAAPEKYNAEWKKWNLEALPIIPEKFRYQPSKDKSQHLAEVKKHLQSADEIIIATDPAREGEYIARIIIQMSGAAKKIIKRLWCSSLTEAAIRNAFQNLRPGKSTEPLFHEALARSQSDWIVGMNSSRAYTLLMQQKGVSEVFSTGRVQTPLLSLIRSREADIERFKAEPYWELEANFETNQHQYKGKHQERYFEKEKAVAILHEIQGKNGMVATVKTEAKSTKPPLLHSLSTLQSKLNKKHKLAPALVLELVQSLYERGHVSYPRSDSQHVTPAEVSTFPEIIHALQSQYLLGKESKLRDIGSDKRYVDEKKVSDHYAIIPTNQVPKLDQLSPDEKKVYDEIAKSLIAAHCPDHRYNQTTILTNIETYEFKSTGRQIIENGWKDIFQDEPEKKDPENQQLPTLNEGQQVKAEPFIKEGMTKPPKHYTEGDLITLMKTAGKHIEDEDLSSMRGMGLGTEATRSGMIQTLKDRKYIIVTKNTVAVTEKGKLLVSAVQGSPLAKPDMTAKWEQYLYQIGQGQKSAAPFIEKSKDLAKMIVEQAKRSSDGWNVSAAVKESEAKLYVGKCPLCGEGVIARKSFYGCTGYQKGCKFTLPGELSGKKISEANARKLLEGKKTGLIKGFKSSKKDTTYNASLKLENHKIQFIYAKK
ncbi:DNA topoisomerase-3 [Thermoactinomyces sp. DSM 45891]|uniref:type IA DNA topoisomerase n=1 Tax=Thermoactinomyces sp. DSM 45891 TaxID=1761907 RepID=UPI0009158D75|nr:type IA DNA topoisomerase [Thermoactinomyces sp. DSM 45891]SFX75084.1 DNA topoisomerase-3 [Thermoactinomyces sp. DSM 45891]